MKRSSANLLAGIMTTLLMISCDTQPTQSDGGVEDNGVREFSHTANPGSSGEAFLRQDPFTELQVEIQYMPGYRPESRTLEGLESFLQEHLDKVSVTILEPEKIAAGGQESYTAGEIRQLEKEHRNHFTDGHILASYNIFVDGEYEKRNVLGIAYYNTSNAYFGKTIHDVSGSPPFSPDRFRIEESVMRHEYGHLLGLVDAGTDMQQHHRANRAHCSEEACIMYATVNTADFFSNLFDGSIPGFDDYCLADIRAVKE